MLESLFHKVADLETPTQVFSLNIAKYLWRAFFVEHLLWLLQNHTTSLKQTHLSFAKITIIFLDDSMDEENE